MKKKDKFNHKDSQTRCLSYRKRILEISQKVSALHLGGAFSCLEIVDCIYFGLMNESKKKDENDIFIMSKGHGCMSQYVVLENKGILTKKNLDEYCTAEGFLGCHPDLGNPGINASTGSLGHGMALSAGVAHALKIKNLQTRVFVVLSDGECDEGSIWEAALFASHNKLKNLVCIIDYNKLQSLTTVKNTLNLEPFSDKWKSFGWIVREIDGHNFKSLKKVFLKKNFSKPLCIIAHTTKGKGVSFMENNFAWHHGGINEENFQIAEKELKNIRK